jgi:hypothetical protein
VWWLGGGEDGGGGPALVSDALSCRTCAPGTLETGGNEVPVWWVGASGPSPPLPYADQDEGINPLIAQPRTSIFTSRTLPKILMALGRSTDV